MTLFNVFSLLGGLALFLFGMDIMGKALEKQAGGHLQKILSKLTDNPSGRRQKASRDGLAGAL